MRYFKPSKAVAAFLTLATWCGSAQAWTGEISWPTFYRAGPGRNYTVLDELDRGTVLEVLSCKGGWCQVQNEGSIGYTEQEWLLPPGEMPSKPGIPGPNGCVASIITGSGYKGGLAYQICPRSAQVSVPSGQPAPGSASP